MTEMDPLIAFCGGIGIGGMQQFVEMAWIAGTDEATEKFRRKAWIAIAEFATLVPESVFAIKAIMGEDSVLANVGLGMVLVKLGWLRWRNHEKWRAPSVEETVN